MLHEHILGEPVPLGAAGATPALSFSWTPARVLQPGCLLSSLTQKCFIPCLPRAGKASHVLSCGFFAVVWVGQGGRKTPAKSGRCCPLSSSGTRQIPLTCCGL